MSDVSEQSPAVDEAAAWFDLGCSLQDAQRYQEALSAFEQAQAIDPNLPFVRHRIAASYFALRDFTTALGLFEAIVRKNPHDVSAWTDICASAHNLRQWDKSLAAGERAFALNPNHPNVLFTFALILNEFRRFKRARHLLSRAAALNPQDAVIALDIALMQLEEGDYRHGWKAYESRWEVVKNFPTMMTLANAAAAIPRWQGESLSKKILMIWPELGLGDSILFVRYLLTLAERAQREDGLILFYCYDPLCTLCARSLAEYCDVLVVSKIAKEIALQPQQFVGRQVVQCPLPSVPLWSGDAIPSQFPYLRPDPIKVDTWRERLSGDTNLKIGISWTGRADHPRNDLRSVPILDLAARLKDIPDVTFYSLQLSHPAQTETAKAAGLIDVTGELGSFDDTAALVSNLDLVIAIDGVIAHLAGALAIPAWVLVDVNPPWMWGRYGRETVWYRSVRIYRQHRMHRWEEVLEEVRIDLCDQRALFQKKI